MREIPKNYYFTKDHEWICEKNGSYRVGISSYAQEELGDVVFVDLPEVGVSLTRGEPMFTVESVKAVSDIYAPINGEVTVVNTALTDSPELVNSDSFNEGWMLEISSSDENPLKGESLMDAASYEAYLAGVKK